MEDPPPKLPWPAKEDVEVEEYTSPPPHETKTISMRFVGRGLVGMVRETMQATHVSLWLRPDQFRRVGRQTSCCLIHLGEWKGCSLKFSLGSHNA
jgi:hypothetical protein